MSLWILSFFVAGFSLGHWSSNQKPHTNKRLHEWAETVVYKKWPKETEILGSYYACEKHALKMHQGPMFDGHGYETISNSPQALGLTNEYPADLINACAISMHGAEF